MIPHANQRTSVSTLLGTKISSSEGRPLGAIREFAVAPAEDAAHVFGLVIRLAKTGSHLPLSLVRVADLTRTSAGYALLTGIQPIVIEDAEAYLLLERDVLDQQIIDVNGHKVVRVNDVAMVWENGIQTDGKSSAPLSLRIAEVEVGLRGAARRLLKGLPEATINNIASRLRPSVIPWDFVDLIDRDPSRRVKLKVEQNRLSSMHPSDIAEILEELGPAERHALFTSLDEEVAAEALEEVEPKMQRALIESLDYERVAGIVEEMDPGAAADFLAELPEERSEAILEEMDPDERHEVEELLEFAGDSAAGRMTTDFVALAETALVADAIAALKVYEGDLDVVTDIILLDPEERIRGLIPVVRLLLADPSTALSTLPHGHVVSCPANASGKKVAETFDKYNLRSLSVVDDKKHLLGVIHAEQVIAHLRSKH